MERPIVFSPEMVRAILDGKKTQTRRPIKPQPDEDGLVRLAGQWLWHDTDVREYRCPLGQPGDRLWVKEAYRIWNIDSLDQFDNPSIPDIIVGSLSSYDQEFIRTRQIEYRADSTSDGPWRSPIHMPRWASRITLEITNIRIERVQDISEESAQKEVPYPASKLSYSLNPFQLAFFDLWNSIYAKRGLGWDANPWVWVIEFKRQRRS